MASIKILHTADIHLDSAFSALSKEKMRARKTHVFQTLDKMIALAKKENVDAFLIAGDLFDGENSSEKTAKTVFEKLGTLAPIRVFIATGNHDPYDGKSFYATMPLPENVHVFSPEKIEEIEFSPGVHIFGRSFSKRYEPSLLTDFHAPEGSLSLMVLHGDLGGGEEYNPISPRAVTESGLSYLALGHIHAPSGVERLGNTFYAYPGAPEGRGFDECGPLGVLLGTVSESGANLEFIPLAEHLYLEENVDVSDLNEEEIRTKIKEIITEKGTEHLYKFVLTGQRSGDFSFRNLQDSLEAEAFFVKIKNKTSVPALLDTASPLAVKFLEFIEEKDANKDVKELAKYFGLSALSGKEVDVLETYES